ncbi:hypothetical protein G6F22_016830 [Rhizopus arrhizus]|nr:hypothetical protein G6F24_014297 [Rhizopus arrhizus]KAG0771053.1 hypothetical protein G6F22_016830 [Rhizopus arrhizus]
MQFARQAQALGIAGAVGQQCARGQKIRVDPGQVIAGQGRAACVVCGQCGERLEAAVQQHHQQRLAEATVAQHRIHRQVGQQRDTQHEARRPVLGQLRDQHHQQHGGGAGARLQRDQGDRQQRLQHGSDRAHTRRHRRPAVQHEQQQEPSKQQQAGGGLAALHRE